MTKIIMVLGRKVFFCVVALGDDVMSLTKSLVSSHVATGFEKSSARSVDDTTKNPYIVRMMADLERIRMEIVNVFGIMELSALRAMEKKIGINDLKYPLEKPEGDVANDGREIPKHTMGDRIGLVSLQDLQEWSRANNVLRAEMSGDSVKALEERIASFSASRGWTYSKYGLALSLRAEYGELCGCLEYVDLEKELHPEVVGKICMELADVFIYSIHCRNLLQKVDE